MCGICGFFGPTDKALLKKMTASMTHRGPDAEGFFTDTGVSLGHRRLSIIDLGGGKQPMHNEDQTVWIVFNGEIYNFLELRSYLEKKGHRFYTDSDTEVIIHAYEEFGLDFGKKLEGIFAAAIWDSKEERLVLLRDQPGTKPLYYTKAGERFLFASEIKALLECQDVEREVDKTALNEYLTYRYVPDPKTLFKGIKKLPAGHILVVENGQEKLRQYWDLSFSDQMSKYTFDDCAKSLRLQLRETVHKQMVSDVPLGAFLSGGIDSSALVALMSENHPEPIKTFTVGFPEGEDESRKAQLVADHLGTDHHHKDVTVDTLSLLPELIWHLDEPIADSAIVPTYIISKFARTKVTVVLSGEGADESFAGYPKYSQVIQRVNLPVPQLLHKLKEPIETIPWQGKPTKAIEHLVRSRDFKDYYFYLGSIFKEREKKHVLKEGLYQKTESVLDRYPTPVRGNGMVESMLYWDIKTFLPGDLLMKADKMSMAASIELRVPYLDHKMLEDAMAIPPAYKLRPQPKAILRKAVADLLPAEILKAKKQGFNVPIQKWMQDGLGERTENLLDESEHFEPTYVKKLSNQHKRGFTDASQKLWAILTFELWHEIFIKGNRKVSL